MWAQIYFLEFIWLFSSNKGKKILWSCTLTVFWRCSKIKFCYVRSVSKETCLYHMAKFLPAQAPFHFIIFTHLSLQNVHPLLNFHLFCPAVWTKRMFYMSKTATRNSAGCFQQVKVPVASTKRISRLSMGTSMQGWISPVPLISSFCLALGKAFWFLLKLRQKWTSINTAKLIIP